MQNFKSFKHQYRLISSDITEHCNQRCLFCFNDFYTQPNKCINMQPKTFLKLIEAMQFVPDNGFFFSCIYEPTLNPNFIELLSMIPTRYRNKVFFTTNLSRPFDTETLQAMSKANIHHLNISVETFNEKLYRKITRTNNYAIFCDNLRQLAEVFSTAPKAPQINYITMVLKDNYRELISIVKKCIEKYGAFQHELRVPYYGTQKDEGFSIPPEISANMEYTKQQLLSKRELDQLQKQLDALSGNILTDFSLDKEIFKREGYLLNIQKQRQQNKFFDVRAFADGRLYFFGLKEYFDINKINDVPGFFTDKLWALNKAYENNQFLEM